MRAIAVVARMTVLEASRRRLLVALGAISLAMVGLSAWGFSRFSHGAGVMTSGEAGASTSASLILFMFMFSFVIALSAIVVSTPAVSGEFESGVAQAVLVRPVTRSAVLGGKWLGMAVVVAVYAALVGALEIVVVWAVSGYSPPNPAAGVAYLIFEGLVVLTLSLALSTRLAPMTAGAVSVALFGGAWLAGVVGTIGSSLRISSLETASRIAKVVLPTDGLWHGAIYYLQPHIILADLSGPSLGRGGDPFLATGAPPLLYVVWAAAWLVGILGAALWAYARIDA